MALCLRQLKLLALTRVSLLNNANAAAAAGASGSADGAAVAMTGGAEAGVHAGASSGGGCVMGQSIGFRPKPAALGGHSSCSIATWYKPAVRVH